MPFAYNTGVIPRAFKHSRQSIHALLYDALCVTGQDMSPVISERIASGENAVAGRRADCRCRIRICKPKAIGTKPIQIRRLNLMGSITAQITEAQIIRIYDNNITWGTFYTHFVLFSYQETERLLISMSSVSCSLHLLLIIYLHL